MSDHTKLCWKHVRLGWWLFLIFAILGVVLESLHGLKIESYLGVENKIRRLTWTLSHAHGTLLALVHFCFAMTVKMTPGWNSGSRTAASRCLVSAGILIPAGFFCGGLFPYAGDPGVGILMVPLGAIALIVAVAMTIRAVSQEQRREESSSDQA